MQFLTYTAEEVFDLLNPRGQELMLNHPLEIWRPSAHEEGFGGET
jgi:hypothetical protein